MINTKPPTILLTVDDVRSWKHQRDGMAAKILELDRKLQAVAQFLPDEARLEIFGTVDLPGATRVKDEVAMVKRFVLDVLAREKRGLTAVELTRIAQESVGEIADYVAANPAAVREAAARQARHSRIRKRGQTYFHPSVMDTARDESDGSGPRDGAAHFRALLLAELASRPGGMTTKDVVALLKSDPVGLAKVNGNFQYPYSLLSRMVAKEFIEKNNGRFYLPKPAPTQSEEPDHTVKMEATTSLKNDMVAA